MLKKKYEIDYNLPILYLTELIAIAMGYTFDELGLKNHRQKPKLIQERFEGGA